MKAVIRRTAETIPLHLEEVDISSDPELEARYGLEIPVLLVNGRKAAKYRVTEQELVRILRGANSAAGGRRRSAGRERPDVQPIGSVRTMRERQRSDEATSRPGLAAVASHGSARRRSVSDHFAVTMKWPRRFCDQQDSVSSLQTGCSFPLLMTVMRLAGIPRLTR